KIVGDTAWNLAWRSRPNDWLLNPIGRLRLFARAAAFGKHPSVLASAAMLHGDNERAVFGGNATNASRHTRVAIAVPGCEHSQNDVPRRESCFGSHGCGRERHLLLRDIFFRRRFDSGCKRCARGRSHGSWKFHLLVWPREGRLDDQLFQMVEYVFAR